MAVIAAKLLRAGSLEGSQTRDDARRYAAVYRITVSSPYDDARVIIDHFADNPVLPWFGDHWDVGNGVDTGAFVREISPRRMDQSRVDWQVTVEFATPDAVDEDGNFTDDPLEFACVVAGTMAQFSHPVERANFKSGFVGSAAAYWPANTSIIPINSAGVPFNPPLEEDMGRQVLRFERNFATVNYDFAENGIVNSEALVVAHRGFFKTVHALGGKVNNWAAGIRHERSIFYWHVGCEMHVKGLNEDNPTWRRRIIDRGLSGRADAGDPDGRGGTISAGDILPGMPVVRPVTDFSGLAMREPILLNGDGQPLTSGATAVQLEYQTLPEVDLRTHDFFTCFLLPP